MNTNKKSIPEVQRDLTQDEEVICVEDSDIDAEFEHEAEWQRLMEEDNSVCGTEDNKSLCRLTRALQNLDVDSFDFEQRAKQLNDVLVGYSLFWGTNADGEPYIEWYNGNNHSITLTYF